MNTQKQHHGESDASFYNRTGHTFAPAACYVVNTRRAWLTVSGRATTDPTILAPATFSTLAAAEALRYLFQSGLQLPLSSPLFGWGINTTHARKYETN